MILSWITVNQLKYSKNLLHIFQPIRGHVGKLTYLAAILSNMTICLAMLIFCWIRNVYTVLSGFRWADIYFLFNCCFGKNEKPKKKLLVVTIYEWICESRSSSSAYMSAIVFRLWPCNAIRSWTVIKLDCLLCRSTYRFDRYISTCIWRILHHLIRMLPDGD